MITMLHYSLKLYKNLPLYQGQNFVLSRSYAHASDADYWDGMAEYLSTQASTDFIDIAPVAIDQTMKMILPIGEALAAYSTDNYNYAMLKTFSENENAIGIFYFFVTNMKRIANNSIQVELTMDCLNTFAKAIFPKLTNRTLVKREHRDRFTAADSFPITHFSLSRIIDPISEGMSVIQDRSTKKTLVSSSDQSLGPSVKWYLIYQTKDELTTSNITNPIDVNICASQALEALRGSSGDPVTWGSDDLVSGTYYYVTPESGNFSVHSLSWSAPAVGSSIPTSSAKDFNFSLTGSVMLIIYKNSSGNVVIEDWHGDGTTNYLTLSSTTTLTDYGSYLSSVTFNTCARLWKSTTKFSSISGAESGTEVYINAGTTGAIYSKAISEVDRTSAKLMKIIELPYNPKIVYKNSGEYSLAGCTFKNGLWSLDSISSALGCTLSDIDLSQIYKTESLGFGTNLLMDQRLYVPTGAYASSSNWSSADATNVDLDSKLYHSDFFTMKFVYDAFSLPIILEKYVQTAYADAPIITPFFTQSTTINSNLCFSFTINRIVDNALYQAPMDYNLTLTSTRNNELPIFSNSYVDYIRSGYNYDKKSKAINAIGRWSNVAFQAVGGAAAAAAGGALAPLAGIGMGVSALTTLTNAITSQMKDDNAIEAKLAGLRMASTNVAGSDDIDILKTYNGDSLILFTFHVNDQMRVSLNDLFHYYGYATNQTKLPDLTSRQCFNFLQAEPYFTAPTKAILGKYYDGIVSEFEDGITIIHHSDQDGDNYWDFDQARFNWETAILKKRG